MPNMYTLSKDSKKILFCDSDVKELQIPSSIYEIMAGSFFNSSLETIVLGENVRKISGCAFDLCKNLKKVVLNSSLESICRSAFSNCENLENIVIPKSVKYIGYVAFTQGNIFCEQTEKPKDWDSEFAVGTAKVYWAGEWEYDKDGNPRPIEKDPVTSNNGNVV